MSGFSQLNPLPVANGGTGTASSGQLPATATNDAAAAGKLGEYAECLVSAATATNTFTNASPTVVTWTAHPYSINASGIVAVGAYYVTNSGGAVPTGLSASTVYYAVPIDANTFHLATTVANAMAGTFINTSSTGTGTNTGHAEAILSTGVSIDIGAVSLTAGDWEARGSYCLDPNASTTTSVQQAWLSTTSATIPAFAARGAYILNASTQVAGQFPVVHLGVQRYSLSATTTIFLGMNMTFLVNVNAGFGFIACRRIR